MKNKSSIVTGLLAGTISLLFLPELFQLLIAVIINVNVDFSLGYFFPIVSLNAQPGSSIWSFVVTGLSPFLYLIIICETGSLLLRKTYAGYYRYSLIIFLLVNIGYMLFYSFFNSVVVILNLGFSTDWKNILSVVGFKDLKYLIYIFFIIILTAGYLNLVTKRVLKYVNVQE
jgi:hypothetical protein